MPVPETPDLKRRLRAMAAWAKEEQPDLARAIDIAPGTFKNYFVESRPGPPVDVALRVADYLGVPRDFVLYGWETVQHDAALERRFAAIESHLGLGAHGRRGSS